MLKKEKVLDEISSQNMFISISAGVVLNEKNENQSYLGNLKT